MKLRWECVIMALAWKRHLPTEYLIASGGQTRQEHAFAEALVLGFPSRLKMPDCTTENWKRGEGPVGVRTSYSHFREEQVVKFLPDSFDFSPRIFHPQLDNGSAR